MLVDYSSWNTWEACPAKWFEVYVNKRMPKWPARQRDDALALGTLVHEGLEVWQSTHTVAIPEKAVEKVTPTPECLQLAVELVYGYSRAYPEERWPLILCEEPLRFPVTLQAEGLAKIDSFFYVPEPYTIESGQPGLQFTLSEGWWIHEYKTKAKDISLGMFMSKWQLNMQASFQTLALQHYLAANPDLAGDNPTVQGVLVNVLEKPKRHVPQRKCKVCNDSYEYATWLPTGEGQYSCPVCGNRQVLQPLKENPVVQNAEYYRIMVTRTPDQLAKAKYDIGVIGERMEGMKAGGLQSEPWNPENCIMYRRPCPYLGNHAGGYPTTEDITFQATDNYRGIEETD